jgi:hypothetical protein
MAVEVQLAAIDRQQSSRSVDRHGRGPTSASFPYEIPIEPVVPVTRQLVSACCLTM